eukprot:scaffold4390_cov108-Isochrysis_galbana.AAC.3
MARLGRHVGSKLATFAEVRLASSTTSTSIVRRAGRSKLRPLILILLWFRLRAHVARRPLATLLHKRAIHGRGCRRGTQKRICGAAMPPLCWVPPLEYMERMSALPAGARDGCSMAAGLLAPCCTGGTIGNPPPMPTPAITPPPMPPW